MPARDYYLKDKTLETLCQREQRPTHAHRCAGLACGARSAPGGWLREARRWVCCGLRRTGGSSSGCRFGFGAFSSSPYTTPLADYTVMPARGADNLFLFSRTSH